MTKNKLLIPVLILIMFLTLSIERTADNLLNPSSKTNVDVELVLAVDISGSIDIHEKLIQKEGYAEVIVSDDFINRIKQGFHGKIAISYFEWGQETSPVHNFIDWHIIDSKESAEIFANQIKFAPIIPKPGNTGLSRAMKHGRNLILSNDLYEGEKKIIDISGDGVDSFSVVSVWKERLNTLALGNITINGLALVFDPDYPRLIEYYKECVILGPSSFVEPVYDIDEFVNAVRRKLIREIGFNNKNEFKYAQLGSQENMLEYKGDLSCDYDAAAYELESQENGPH